MKAASAWLIAILCAIAVPVQAAAQDLAADLVGVWRLTGL
jgi:hypothetical protein